MTSALVPPLLIFFATDDSVDLQIIHKPRRTARELPHRLPGQRNPNRWRSCGSLVLGEADIIGGSGRLIISLRKLSIPCITIMFFWFLLLFSAFGGGHLGRNRHIYFKHAFTRGGVNNG